MQPPRRFRLDRFEDISGVSGVGTVAWGVQFADGVAVMRWSTSLPVHATGIYANVSDIEAIHGHGGLTRVVWLDPAISAPNPG